jgi:hypothetical protein
MIDSPEGYTETIGFCAKQLVEANKRAIYMYFGLSLGSICQVQGPCEQFTARRKPTCALFNIGTHVV